MPRPIRVAAAFLLALVLTACSDSGTTGTVPPTGPPKANVMSATTSGTSGNYTFEVTVSSPDQGCDEYANWWEVISQEGELIYRKTFDRPHVDEQPFTTEGGPVQIPNDQIVIVRAHMKEAGYGGQAVEGAPGASGSFRPVALPDSFAFDIDDISPQPGICEGQ